MRNIVRPEKVVFLITITLGVLAAPLLPSDMMNNGSSLCVFHALGIERIFEVVRIHGACYGLGCYGCPGCGMSRALWAILHGDINRALSFNWRVIIVAPIFAALYFQLAASTIRRWFLRP
jgi:hypothetical protein